MVNRTQSAVAVALLAAALAACSRASSPPPASDAATVTPPAPEASGPASPEPAPAAAEPTPSVAPEPAPAASASPNPWTTPSNCKDSSADARAHATCEAKEEFRSFVAAHQSCSAATDCAVVTGSCPFGCFVPVSKASQAETLAKLGTLGDRLDKAGHRCVYRCMSPPAAACVAGRCSSAGAN